jgi:phenylalanyl-tRNA synthetase beta chain
MKLSHNYLQTILPVSLSPEKTAEILTECGLEVEGIEKYESIRGGLAGLVVGHVLEKSKHPDADRLNLTKVDVGAGILDIVCGATNVEVGQKVIVATDGVTVYPTEGEPFTIKKSKIRGQASEGMICAEDEIGLGKSHEGIKVLPAELEVGTSVADYFRVNVDHTIEINITPNRPDAASHLGSARDIIARLRLENPSLELKYPSVGKFEAQSNNSPIQISIENNDACKRYGGIYITNVQVGESPDWLKDFLKTVGLRPINNIVDITNFVLFETGQPLHAFDADQIKGNKIIVKNCSEGTSFKTLDGVERILSADDLMICNAEEPMCMAGIFGGADSGVTEKTVNVFLESARFEPSFIRRSSKRHGLKTDSSFRFERGTDPNGTEYAAKRAALLIQEIAGGTIASEFNDIYKEPFTERNVVLRKSVLGRVTGLEIPDDAVTKILEGLGCKITSTDGEGFHVWIPLYKTDVTREIDLVEEVIRIYGYDRVPLRGNVTYTQAETKGEGDRYAFYAKVANHLASQGYQEILTNSLVHSKFTEVLGLNAEEDVKILNPISVELDVMRQSLLGSGLHVVSSNINRRNTDLKLFEFGKTYKTAIGENPTAEKPIGPFAEKEVLSFWITGNEQNESWKNATKAADLYTVKAALESVFAKIGLKEKVTSESIQNVAYAEAFTLKGAKSGELGKAGRIKASTLKAFDIKADVYYAELDVNKLFTSVEKEKTTFRDIPKFPYVRRDLALLLDKSVSYADLEAAAKKAERQLLKEVNLFDVYEGKNLPEGKKSYAISFILRDDEKTLTDEITEGVMKRIIETYEKQFGASLRQ